MSIIRESLFFALVACCAGCQSAGSTPPSAQPESDALGEALSPCGRYTLRLDHAGWQGEPDQKPRLTLQMTCKTGEEDVFPCADARITDFVSEKGVEWREPGLEGRSSVRGRRNSVIVHNLKQYERAASAKRVRVECHVLRVFEWTTFEFSSPEPGHEQELICPPYHVGVYAEPDRCRISASCTDDWKTFPAAQRDLFLLLGHDWVASGVELRDAAGRALDLGGAVGTGGGTVAMYGRPGPARDAEEKRIRYPLRGTLRIPKRYVVEIVPFEFTDLRLVREERP